jgi:hypothetical protein
MRDSSPPLLFDEQHHSQAQRLEESWPLMSFHLAAIAAGDVLAWLNGKNRFIGDYHR